MKNVEKPIANIDVPVIINFFNRPDVLKEVFEQVRIARPTKLFLSQDGPRENNQSDIEKINECRRVVDNIDWECELRTNYSEINLGCGMRMYSAISWAFEYVDRLVILEDDIVVSQSMFRFCKEMLEMYKDDERISRISGLNHLGIYNEPNTSYFFSSKGGISGWATWKRAWKDIEFDVEFKSDLYVMKLLQRTIYPMKNANKMINKADQVKQLLNEGKKLSAWTYQFRMSELLQSRLIIVPTKNLITNIGNEGGVHNNIKRKDITRNSIWFKEKYELIFPLVHPKYVVNDLYYHDKVDAFMRGITSFHSKIFNRIISILKIK